MSPRTSTWTEIAGSILPSPAAVFRGGGVLTYRLGSSSRTAVKAVEAITARPKRSSSMMAMRGALSSRRRQSTWHHCRRMMSQYLCKAHDSMSYGNCCQRYCEQDGPEFQCLFSSRRCRGSPSDYYCITTWYRVLRCGALHSQGIDLDLPIPGAAHGTSTKRINTACSLTPATFLLLGLFHDDCYDRHDFDNGSRSNNQPDTGSLLSITPRIA